MYDKIVRSASCNVHNSEWVTQKRARCDASHNRCEWPEGGTKSPDCHHLHVNVLICTINHPPWLKKCVLFCFLLHWNHHWKVYNIQNCKLCFLHMKIMSLRNGGDSVNNEAWITTNPLRHNFHIKETQFYILYVLHSSPIFIQFTCDISVISIGRAMAQW